MYIIDLGDDGTDDALEMASRSQRELWARGIDPGGLDPFRTKILAGTFAEVDLMSEEELDTLAAEGQAALDDERQAKLDAYIDELPGAEFSNVMSEASAYGDGAVDYLDFSRSINESLAAATDRERIRQEEDQADRERRRGPHRNRLSTEETLQRGLARYTAGSYVRDQVSADLASTMFDESDFATRLATPQELQDELAYQLTGQGVPIARQYVQPPVHQLSTRQLTQLGLRP